METAHPFVAVPSFAALPSIALHSRSMGRGKAKGAELGAALDGPWWQMGPAMGPMGRMGP